MEGYGGTLLLQLGQHRLIPQELIRHLAPQIHRRHDFSQPDSDVKVVLTP